MKKIRPAAVVLAVLILAVCLWQIRAPQNENYSDDADRFSGTTWYKSDANGFQPVDDMPMLVFNDDGTGELRLEAGADAMLFTYEVVDEHYIKLTDNSNGFAPVLEEAWTELYFHLFSFYGTDVDIMSVIGDKLYRLYSKPAQRLENGSVRYSNGVVLTELPPFSHSAQLEERMSDTQWFQADYTCFQPADNPPVITFNSDGTGELWLNTGDGCSVTYVTYEAADGGCLLLSDNGTDDGVSKPLDSSWSKLHISFSRWEGTDVEVMTVQTCDGTVYVFFSEMAERLSSISVKLSDGTVISTPYDR